MEVFKLSELTFFYPGQEAPTLDRLSFTIESGQFVAVAGASGSGKTTLLRQFKTVLCPHGSHSGQLEFFGEPLSKVKLDIQSEKIGFVLQSPENQIVTDKVWHELAFGLESLGYETSVIRTRVAEMAAFFGIEEWFYKPVSELSGGQKQLLCLASVMAMYPQVLILDEPTSRLDPIAGEEFISTLVKINRDLGTTIIISEHRLDNVLPYADRVMLMEEGRLIRDGAPRTVGQWLNESKHPMFQAMPTPMRIYAAVSSEQLCPLTVKEGREWLETFSAKHELFKICRADEEGTRKEPAISMKGLWFRYSKNEPDILKNLDLVVGRGELFAIVGGNGAGKSTILSIAAGLQKPQRGKAEAFGKAALLPQEPQMVFSRKTVREDLHEMKDKGDADFNKSLTGVIELCRLNKLLDRHPFDLSGGETQRAAIAKILLSKPDILLLDEPTKGMDAQAKTELSKILHSLTADGATIVMVSHDLDFCAENADQCALLFDGAIASQGTPHDFFRGNIFYTTSANRMARNVLPQAVTAPEIIFACAGEAPPKAESIAIEKTCTEEKREFRVSDFQTNDTALKKNALSKRTIAAAIMILLAIPATILIGMYYLEDRKYTFISLLALLEAMLPFFLIFEGRKPQARELIIISVLCALGVAGRAAFIILPQFKPVAAIVIISGAAFGGETGFLVGAVSMLVSNVMFGQGPWTPWQMFAMGIIGFLAGMLFKKKLISSSPLPLSIFGAFCTVIIYGGVMNTSSVLMYQANPTMEMLIASYAAGLPFDLIHAASTFLFLLFVSRAMLEKLDRVKIKYGILE